MANTKLKSEIEKLHGALDQHDPASEEYAKVMKQLEILYKVEHEHYFIKPEAVLNASVYLVGTILVLYFEKFDIISSKAFGWIKKI